MNARGKLFDLVILLFAALLVLPCGDAGAATAPSAPGVGPKDKTAAPTKPQDSWNPEMQKLLKAAAAEGGIINGVSSTYDIPGFGKAVEQGMSEYFGMKFTLNVIAGPVQAQLGTRILQEIAAGRQATTDFWTATDPDMVRLWNAGGLLKVEWKKYLPAIPDTAIGPDGTSLAYDTQIKSVLYNTNMVRGDDIPRVLADTLKPKFAKQVASTPYSTGFDLAAVFGVGEKYMKEYIENLVAKSLAGLIRCGEYERVATGEFAMLAVTCSTGLVTQLMEAGAPIDFVVMKDMPVMNYSYQAIPKNAMHPASATLLMLFGQTQRGQALHWKFERQGLAEYDYSPVRKIVQQKVLDRDIKPLRVNAVMLSKMKDELERIKTAQQRLLRGERY
jgi:ABC-type Fe3+ transport system substrate-binding protein